MTNHNNNNAPRAGLVIASLGWWALCIVGPVAVAILILIGAAL